MVLFSSPQGILCLLALSFWSILQVSGHSQVMDCCVRTSPIPIPAKIVRSYREQHVQEGCLLQAVVNAANATRSIHPFHIQPRESDFEESFWTVPENCPVLDGCGMERILPSVSTEFLRAINSFITFRGKHLCAPSHAWWVKHLKVRLDQRWHLKRSPWTPS